ncbi:MAG: hypothetical protein LBS31_12970 [Candidatus Adiutrix sp.]|jgi:hypothetical protein|nr:hypothetical protein [Candidatus Adiutrix sp.]
MKIIEYEKLLAELAPLDISTLTRLEADLARLVQRRQAEKSGQRRSIMELAALAGESLRDLEPEKYWSEREKNLAESRASWADRENEFAGKSLT